MNTAGLSTEQAPPLAVPLTFYATAPLAMLAGGVLLASEGSALFLSAWLPRTIALAHVGTLGVLLAVMCGSLYQMVPVVIGERVPASRLAFAVAPVLALGGVLLVFGLWTANALAVRLAAFALGGALVTFVAPVALALVRARGGETLLGMRIALASLVGLATLGLRLAWGHATGDMPASRLPLLVAHVDLALVGWVGGLVTAVSWRVVPMFYLTAELPPRRARALAWVLGASVALVFAAALAGAGPRWVIAAALPGAIVVLGVQPLALASLLRARRRRRRDPSLQFWWLSIGAAPAVLSVAVAAWLTDVGRASVLLGWLAIFGWAGAAVHGMLSRIVPFLVWLDRFAKVAGLAEVPPMKRLLPDERVRVQLLAHGATLGLGALAIATGSDLLARATGVLLATTGALLGTSLVGVLRRAAQASPRQA